MEKLLKYCLSIMLLSILTTFMACQSNIKYYKKTFTDEERLEQAELLLSGLGYRYYYQGSTGEQALLEEAAMYNELHPEVWRERGIPYLKRGIAHGYYEPYQKCAELDPVNWQGYKGYCTLYFYRDYESALNDFDKLDPLTPDFIDYPQATSIEYMRAICYFGMGQYENALRFIDKHIEYEIKEVGLNYVTSVAFILKSEAHLALHQLDDAQASLELGLKAHDKNADIEYRLAKIHYKKGQNKDAMKYADKSKQSFLEGFTNSRPYVEEFFQVYLADIEELKEKIEFVD